MLRLFRVHSPAVAAGLMALLGLAGGSLAQEGAGMIDEATDAFSTLDFEGALVKLDQAQKTPGNTPQDLVRIHSLRARCLISLGRDAEAEQAFSAALSIDPSFRLSPDTSPRFAEPFSMLLDRGVPALQVDVVPPAEVVLGEPVLITVQVVADPAGIADHLRLKYRRASKKYSSLKVTLVAGKRSRFYLPPSMWKSEGQEALEWYCEIRDRFGGLLAQKGDPDHPLRVVVKEKPKIAVPVLPPPPPALVPTGPPAEPPPPSPAWYQRWWIWAIVGGAAVAVGTTVGILAASGEEPDHRTFSIQIQ